MLLPTMRQSCPPIWTYCCPELREAARSDEDAAFVLLHATDYARYGEYYAQLLELAAEEPTARPFVAQMLQKYPSDASAGLMHPM